MIGKLLGYDCTWGWEASGGGQAIGQAAASAGHMAGWAGSERVGKSTDGGKGLGSGL